MLEVRGYVTVAEIITSTRGLAAEVAVDHIEVGLDQPSVINCDGLHTVTQESLTGPVGRGGDDVSSKVCSAVNYAFVTLQRGMRRRRSPPTPGKARYLGLTG